MKLNRKLWTAALAVAMTTPSAMAAQDTAGMQYTSAAEGFYASIRVRFNANGGKKEGASNVGNSGSRFGIRGTNDLGGGLEGFYQYEMGVSTENGDKEMSTRVGHVGLRGDFGAIVGGSFWTDSYNWVYGSTDIANVASGNFAYGEFGQGRSKKSVQYTTPDLNGFQGAFLVQMDSSKDGEGGVGPKASRTIDIDYVVSTVVVAAPATLIVGDPVTYSAQRKTVVNAPVKKKNTKDDTDVDHWSLAAAYNIAGFSMGASYSVFPDASAGLASKYTDQLIEAADNNGWDAVGFDTKVDDLTAWAVKLGYSQDNWYVNSWYGAESTDKIGSYKLLDYSTPPGSTVTVDKVVSVDDTVVFSIAGGISVDKVNVYALYENKEHDFFADKDGDGEVDKHLRGDDSYYTLGLQYSLGSRSRVWAEYAGQDLNSSENEDGDFNIGLRHDF